MKICGTLLGIRSKIFNTFHSVQSLVYGSDLKSDTGFGSSVNSSNALSLKANVLD